MSDVLSIGSSAVQAYQAALATVANNIANMNSVGYSREQVTLAPVGTAGHDSRNVGAGVLVKGVQRAWDQLAQANLLSSNSSLSTQTPMVKFANQVVNALGDVQSGLSPALDNFFSAAQSLSASPADSALRGQYLSSAQSLATSFQTLAGQLATVEQNSGAELRSNLDQFNALGEQLALVNGQLSTGFTAASQPPALLDERDQILSQMSNLAGIQISYAPNGMVNVGIGQAGGQATVVRGMSAKPIGVVMSATSPGKVDFQIDPQGSATPLTTLTSGSIAGIAAFRQQVLDPAQSGLDTLAAKMASTVNGLQASGIDAYGDVGSPLFGFKTPDGTPAARSAAALQVLLTDPQKIATGALFRSIGAPANSSPAQASISFTAPAHDGPAAPPLPGPAVLGTLLGNNPASNPAVDLRVSASGVLQPLTTIPAGYSNTSLLLQTNPSSGLDLRIFTRDGTQLLGPPLASADQAALVSNPANGFAPGTAVPLQNLANASGASYEGLRISYGAQATPLGTPSTATLPSSTLPLGQGWTLDSGAIKVNGIALPALASTTLTPATNGFSAAAVAGWLQSGLQGSNPSVSVSASNTLTLSASSLQLSSAVPFSLNGVTITPPAAGFQSASDLSNAINGISTSSGVAASVGADGSLTLQSCYDPRAGAFSEGRDFTIGNPLPSSQVSCLGMAVPASGTVMRGSISLSSSAAIAVTGAASDLAKLGLRAEARLDGTVPEDLLVFGAAPAGSNGIGTLAAGYQSGTLDPLAAQRSEPLTLRFTSTNTYTITDATTGTLLATRTGYNAASGIHYRNLAITLDGPPAAGDQFMIDGNQDGQGDNANIRAVAAMQTRTDIFPNNQTINDAYNGIVSSAGQASTQATIAQQALTVVNQQAVKAVDQASGVNINTEAADLIRFQQAYQASAKTIEVANQLFDTIAQLRA